VNNWVGSRIPPGPRPAIARPINYAKGIFVTTAILGVLTVLKVAWPLIQPVLQNRNLWAAISLIMILLFTSGHMFNHIRKVPYVSGNGKGGISYFAGGFSNQYGMETQIVAAMCKSREAYTSYHFKFANMTLRRYSLFCDHHLSSQSSPYRRPPDTEAHYLARLWYPTRDVQLPAQCFQDEERWIPILPTSIQLNIFRDGESAGKILR
jgi:OST3 / OST6 family, transporter family